jgi:hypothetical protein
VQQRNVAPEANFALRVVGVAWVVLSGPATAALVATLAFGRGASGGGFALVALLGPLVALAPTVVTLVVAHYASLMTHLAPVDKVMVAVSDERDSRWARWQRWWFNTRLGVEWPDSSVLVVRWGFLFEHGAALSFVASEALCGAAINMLIGAMQYEYATQSHCRAAAIATLLLHAPPLLQLALQAALLSRFDTVMTIAGWATNAAIAIVVVISLFRPESDAALVINALNMLTAFLGLVGSFAAAIDLCSRAWAQWMQREPVVELGALMASPSVDDELMREIRADLVRNGVDVAPPTAEPESAAPDEKFDVVLDAEVDAIQAELAASHAPPPPPLPSPPPPPPPPPPTPNLRNLFDDDHDEIALPLAASASMAANQQVRAGQRSQELEQRRREMRRALETAETRGGGGVSAIERHDL